MSKPKILIVDDDPDLRRGLNLRLRASQFETAYAADGFSAIVMAQKEHPDLIILDIGLPAGDGFVVLDRLQQSATLATIPVIVLTARDPQSSRDRSLKEKANGDCVFYDRQAGCTIYPVRPRQCRTWPFWESNVVTPEAWQKTCVVCPGTGQGELISEEEITRRIKVIRL